MGFFKKFFSQTRRPEGTLGKIMVNGMNSGGHSTLAEWGFSFVDINRNDTALDCGCGGGANVKRLLSKCDKAYGIDYSEVSVANPKRLMRRISQKVAVKYISATFAHFLLITIRSTRLLRLKRFTSGRRLTRRLPRYSEF